MALLSGCGFQIGVGPSDGAVDSDLTVDAEPLIDVVLPDAPSSCLDGAWCRRIRLEIPAGRAVAGPHASFPLLVTRIADAQLAQYARADGHDLVFTDADGTTRLPYERARFDGNTGQLIAWVKVPALQSAAPTVLYLYYGNAGAAEQADPEAVWDASYAGVWHVDGNDDDSTQHENDGSTSGSIAFDPMGKVGTCANFSGAGGRITIDDSPSLDATAAAGTLAMWVRFADATSRIQLILSTSNALDTPSDGISWSVQADGDHYFYPLVVDENYNLVTNPFTDATWHMAHVTWSFASKNVSIYVDGAPRTITVMNVGALWSRVANPANWLWGQNPDEPAQQFLGRLDEMRAQTVVRSAGWIQTEYRNQNTSTAFVDWGAPELLQ